MMKVSSLTRIGLVALAVCVCMPALAQVGIFDSTTDWFSPETPRTTMKVAGSASFADGVYSLEGNGDDIYNEADEGFFVYSEKSGSMSLSARVSWIDPGGNDWAKLGVMIREKPEEPGSRQFWIELRGALWGDQVDNQMRLTEDGASVNPAGAIIDPDGVQVEALADGIFLRVTRIADLGLFVAEVSYDGSDWFIADSVTIPDWGDTAAYGLAITNHDDNDVIAYGTADNVVLGSPSALPMFANRKLSSGSFKDGDTVEVTINITNPNEDAATVSVSDTAPEGWTISDISDGGSASGQTISWSASAPHGVTALTYKVTATTAGDVNIFAGTLGSDAIVGGSSIAKIQDAPEGDQIFDLHADIFDDPANVGTDADGNALLGSATYDATTNTYEIQGGGLDIWETADQFHFLYTEVSGDFVMECNMEHDESERSTSTNDWIKGMMMGRQNLTAGSPNFGTRCRRDGQFSWQMRAAQDGSSTSDGDNRITFTTEGYFEDEYPRQRLVREGDSWDIFFRDDLGAGDWIKVQDTQTLVMEDPILVGLAVTAHDVGTVQFTWFRDVTLVYDAAVNDWMIME